MSVLPADAHQQLLQLLQGLQNSDNDVRTQAEEALNNDWVARRPEMLLMGLAELVKNSQELLVRSFSSVLFRRMAVKSRKNNVGEGTQDLYFSLQSQVREAIRNTLVEALLSEQDESVRHKIGDAVAEVARQYSADGEQWPELLGALFQCSQAENVGQRETAFRIFASTPDIIEKQHEQAVLGVFVKGFKDTETTVRLAAVEAFASFFRELNKGSRKKYYAVIPDILNILPPILESKDDEQLSRALLALIDLAEVAPTMFKPLFHNLVTFSISVIQDKELEDQTRQNALELMATFADFAAAMCKKDASYTESMVTQCLSLMTDVGVDDDDAAEWNNTDDLDMDESDMNHIAGEQCLDRLANKLGGQTLLPPTFNWLPRMMTSTAWRDRHAALMAISAISEGCRELMVGELDKVIDLVLPALQDSHPRVRWAACNALGQMSTDFAGTMQEKYHGVVLPAIIPVLKSSQPRVQAHAAAALVNFCEEAEKEVLEPYLDDLLTELVHLLQNPKRYVQEQSLSTIATVADSAEAAFGRYYDHLMPLLFEVLRSESSKDFQLLRAKAMECATLIALAVTKQKMGQDALTLVQLLGGIQQGITEPDDPQASYLLHCWGRMCRVLGPDFIPYLPGVMPPLLELASAKADIQMLEDEEQLNQLDEQDGWELVPLKGKYIGIKTSTLDDKHTAIELIVIYAQQLEATFEPYVSKIMYEIAIPGLEFFFHEPVRAASAKAIPQLLNAYKKAHGVRSPVVVEMWSKTIQKILEVISTEPNIETLAEMYQCFYEAVEVMGPNCLSEEHMNNFITSARTVLNEYEVRVAQRNEERKQLEDGEDEEEEMLFAIEDDQNLLSDINKAFHSLLKNMSTAFLPYFQQLVEFYDRFVKSEDSSQRQWALCIYCDLLEFCGPQAWSQQQRIIDPIVSGLRDPEPANRQAAAYAAGVAAQKGGEQWAEFAAGTLPLLFGICTSSNARDEDHIYATENACTSIAKVLHFSPSKVPNFQEVVQHWIDTLPVVNDEEAAPHAYGFLVQLIEQGNPAVISQPAKVFTFMAQALEAETIQGQVAAKVVEAGKKLVTSTGVDAAQLLASLPPETQKTVTVYFS